MPSLGDPNKVPDVFRSVGIALPQKSREGLDAITGIQNDIKFVDANKHNQIGQEGIFKTFNPATCKSRPPKTYGSKTVCCRFGPICSVRTVDQSQCPF